MSRLSHSEVHMVHRTGWLRAAVLGANDGLIKRQKNDAADAEAIVEAALRPAPEKNAPIAILPKSSGQLAVTTRTTQ